MAVRAFSGNWHGDCLSPRNPHEVCGLVEQNVADGQQDADITSTTVTPDPAPLPDFKQHADAIVAARQQSDSLIAEIQGQTSAATTKTSEIELVRLAAEKAKVDIDARLTEMSTAVAALTPQIESARAIAAEITSLAASSQAANAASNETAKQALAAIESAKQITSTASEIIGKIEGIRDEAVKMQATIAERNKFIQDGLEHVAKVQRELDEVLDSAKRSAGAAETHQTATKTTSDSATALHAIVLAAKERVESDAVVASSTRATIEGHATVTKKLAKVATDIEARIAGYETALAQMQDANKRQAERIDEILAGATDGSLGGAYRKRGEDFKPTEKNWQRFFIASLIGLLTLAGWQAYSLGNLAKPPEWEELARMMLFKLPFLIPLVWLAIHSARQASFAKRMEEEYAFKATTSFSFEGYRRQMKDVGADLDANSPLAQLCNNTLKTIAAPPGKVYDKHRMDPTPGTAAAEIVSPVVEGVRKTLAANLPEFNP